MMESNNDKIQTCGNLIAKILTGTIFVLGGFMNVSAEKVSSPDNRLVLAVDTLLGGRPAYSVIYDGQTILKESPLGFVNSEGINFSDGMELTDAKTESIHKSYTQDRIKKRRVDWEAKRMVTSFRGVDGKTVDIEWYIGNNDIAFRYLVPRQNGRGSMVITQENTGYRFIGETTMFVTSQSDAMIGWKRTKPSYEEEYLVDVPISAKSQYGQGFTWPALFKVANQYWVLLSETDVDGYYCASHMSDSDNGVFTVKYPMPEENNGNGNFAPGVALPAKTPWRTITIGNNLAPIVETTIPWNLVEPKYEPLEPARPGRSTWSWLLWQDKSINFDDQKLFIDFANEMGYENVLIDNWWDKRIGRERMVELINYAKSKNVNVILWYSSSGHWNDIEQSPINLMDRPIVRKKEMKWLRDNGVRNIKVDFFGGDKQETMRLYEDILSDAADYGIDVIFHGCTLPRGWERMYPNFVGAEAVLASENFGGSQDFCDREAVNASLHPFIRNTVACMEYGGTILNKRFNRNNNGGKYRKTGDGFQLATAVLFQNPVQNFALAPNNLTDAPAEAIEFMKKVPTTWDDIKFIEGYPGKYVVLARKHDGKWYVAGINGTNAPLKIKLNPEDWGCNVQSAQLYYDKDNALQTERISLKGSRQTNVSIPVMGGFVMIIND